MSVTITINTEPILIEVQQKSYMNTEHIKDLEDKYASRAREEADMEVRRCISDGFAQLSHRCLRFLDDEVVPSFNDDPYWPESYVYCFALSERRAINKAEPLTAAMHAFVVQYALSKWYSTVSESEQSNKYSLEAIESGNQIDAMLYHKQPPRV